MKALVFTRHADKGVTVTYPILSIFDYMTGGGGYWDEYPRGFLDELIRRKTCPHLQKGNPVKPDAARRFVNAMQFGGLTTAEAWGVIAGHDCERFGHLVELQDTEELPDRWFRDAWKRSANGGPVGVDLQAARYIQWNHIVRAVRAENRKREQDLFGPPELKVNRIEYAAAIKHARDEQELRKVWPPNLSLS